MRSPRVFRLLIASTSFSPLLRSIFIMKTPFYRLLSIAFISIFAATGVVSAETRENTRLQEGKITKNEAQHLVLKQFPGATIKSCELKTVNGHSVWVVSLTKSGDKTVAKVQVDGVTGKITP